MMSRSCVFNTRKQSNNHNNHRRNWIFHHMASTIIDHHHQRRNDNKSKKPSSPISSSSPSSSSEKLKVGGGEGRLSQVSWRAVCEIAASECACRWVQYTECRIQLCTLREYTVYAGVYKTDCRMHLCVCISMKQKMQNTAHTLATE